GEAGPNTRSTSTSCRRTSNGPPAIIRPRIPSTSGDRRCPTISSSTTRRRRALERMTRTRAGVTGHGTRHHREEAMTIGRRIAACALALCTLSITAGGALAQGAQPPIRIGSTLRLTGPRAATSLVHKVVGEIYVDQLNQRGGLLGRKVEWIVKDDQSKPDLARTLYEQLITTDKVDLLMGPYATGAILSAMGVAQRYNKVLVHHTFGIPSLAKYDMQF